MREIVTCRFLVFILLVTLSGVEGRLFGQNASAENNRTIDSLKLALKNAKHDTTRCQVLSMLTETANDEELLVFANQLKSISEKNLSKNSTLKKLYIKHFIIALVNLAYLVETIENNSLKAIEYYQQILKLQKSINDTKGMAFSLNNLGQLYNNQGDIQKALDYQYKSLKIYELLEDKIGIATSLNNVAELYNNQGDEKKALEYHYKSLKINIELDDQASIAKSLINIGGIYGVQGYLNKALDNYFKSLKIYEETKNKSGIANALNGIATLYYKQGDKSKALNYLQQSLRINEEIGNKFQTCGNLHNISHIYNELGDINVALSYSLKSMQFAKEIGFPQDIQYSAKELKIIFKKQNKYKEAFEMFELEIKMRDSINNQETQKAAVKKQMQYTYEKKELETKAEQDKKDAIAKAELTQKENERNYFIVGFGLVAVLALFILRGYKQKQKANEIIAAQKHLVDEKQKEILDSIHYAKRIQTALMPSEKYIDKSLKQLNKDV